MASVVSSSNVFSFKGILPKKDSALLANSSRIGLKKSSCTRSRVCVRANYDEFKPEEAEKDEVIDVKPCEPSAIDHLKKAFLGSLDGIEGGVKATRDTRGVISEFISQLESHNPTPVLTQGLPLLNGKWFLVLMTAVWLWAWVCAKIMFQIQAVYFGSTPKLLREHVTPVEEDPSESSEIDNLEKEEELPELSKNDILEKEEGPYEQSEIDSLMKEEPCEPSKINNLKKELMDSLYGTDGGSIASGETRGKISELISHLELNNPTPVLKEGLPLLNGKWFLVYTTFIPLFPFLAKGDSSLLKVGEISEVIDSENLTSKQSIELVGLLSTISLSTQAKFEVQSPKRIEIKIEEGIIGTPQITDWIASPHVTNLIEAVENMDLFGQKIDLSHFKSITSYIQHSLSALISGASPLKIPVPKNNESWFVVTYLDEELRIERGDGGCEFVFVKEGSLLLAA